ncbi:MAG: type II toxin-antitoxin system PemK/MazF family toxin [Gemmatimonadetes bacterium]|nr:type II toxin-antitoxin system PemK/MazF family toxin [Gemmatimonadota bacterium]
MAYSGPVHRWDLFWADLDFPVGSEQGGERRPVLVVSNDGVNAFLPVITQVPLTKLEGKERKVYPFEVILPRGIVGTRWVSIAMPQQIRTIDKTRLIEKIGTLLDVDLQVEIENRLLEHLGIAFEVDDL